MIWKRRQRTKTLCRPHPSFPPFLFVLINIAISFIVSINVGIIIVIIPTEVGKYLQGVEVKHQAVAVADRDKDGLAQLCHDGRLPLQVLGDVGVLDIVKCHHLQSHLLVHDDVAGQQHHFVRVGWSKSTNDCKKKNHRYLRTCPPAEDEVKTPRISSAQRLALSISFLLVCLYLSMKSQQDFYVEIIVFLKNCPVYFSLRG